MAIDVAMLDPGVLQKLFGTQRDGSKEEKVIYYKAPEITVMGKPYANASWIDWGDSQSSKRMVMIERGWIPLTKFGPVRDSLFPWVTILMHPDGPAMFPVEQLLSQRWWNRDILKAQWPAEPRTYYGTPTMPSGFTPERLFKQLAGVQIVEYQCPQCTDRTVRTPMGLFQHLSITHDWDTKDIFTYGEKAGIDFEIVFNKRSKIDFTFGSDDSVDEEDPEPVGFEVTTIGGADGRTAGRPRDRLGHLLPGKPVQTKEDEQ